MSATIINIMSQKITHYSITPIFNFGMGDDEFFHSGTYNGAKYSISLGSSKYQTLINKKDIDPAIKSQILNIRSFELFPIVDFSGHRENFLILEISYHYSEKYEKPAATFEMQYIQNYILTALRLHCSIGILYNHTYSFKCPAIPNVNSSFSKSIPHTKQYSESHLRGGLSFLQISEYENCKQTFDILLRNHNKNTSFDNIINLAISYHKTSFSLELKEHSYLMLMVIFESLFKKDSRESAKKAADRISKIISNEPKQQLSIKEEFYKKEEKDRFCDIRNDIAHGDPSLNHDDLDSKYPILYKYITKSMIKLISISDSEVDKSNDYYDELIKYINS